MLTNKPNKVKVYKYYIDIKKVRISLSLHFINKRKDIRISDL